MVIAVNRDIFSMEGDPQFLQTDNADNNANTAFAVFSQNWQALKHEGAGIKPNALRLFSNSI